MSPRTTGRGELGGVGRRMADAEHVTPGKLAERAGAASTRCASDVRRTRHRRIAASSVETLAGSDAAVAGDDGLNEEAPTPRPALAPEPGRREWAALASSTFAGAGRRDSGSSIPRIC